MDSTDITLRGTDKQVAWALDIRARMASDIEAMASQPDKPAQAAAEIRRLGIVVLDHHDAAFYIDRRSTSAWDLLLEAYKAEQS